MGMVKLFQTPEFRCDDGSGAMVKCSEEKVCNLRKMGGVWGYLEDDQSLVKEFNLICADKMYLGLFGAVFFIG
jgi:hypothetical protein